MVGATTTTMTGWARTAALAACAMLGAPATVLAADNPPLVGLFEGHGIAPPADPARARLAMLAARQLSRPCGCPGREESQIAALESCPCAAAERTLAELGPDAAAAILDVLDQRQVYVWEGIEGYLFSPADVVLRALARTRRADVVPILVRAMDRLQALNESHKDLVEGCDPQGSEIACYGVFRRWRSFLIPLEEITGALTIGDDVLGFWRRWLQQHERESAAEWQATATAEARRVLRNRSADDSSVAVAAQRLARYRETFEEARASLRQFVARSECANHACPLAEKQLYALTVASKR